MEWHKEADIRITDQNGPDGWFTPIVDAQGEVKAYIPAGTLAEGWADDFLREHNAHEPMVEALERSYCYIAEVAPNTGLVEYIEAALALAKSNKKGDA